MDQHTGGYDPTAGAVPPTQGMAPYGGGPQPPVPSPGHAAQEPILLWIGDIGVSQHWVVTPNGNAPLAGSQWIVRDGTRVEESIPGYAIALAIIFFIFCLLGLLFLLIKERRTSGYVEVTVRAGDVYHVTQLPARHAMEVDGIRRLVHQAQSMAYAQGPR
jgi:hypothetical protein